MRYFICEYYELYQGHPTSHREEMISANSIEEAKKVATEKYGWGSFARPLMCVYCEKNQCNNYDDACDNCVQRARQMGCDVSELKFATGVEL